ncbi:hypothetical protein HYT84_04975 [Candidatus Micrarchaeota archaeon]|nr:hypothetical protein [Candidatus Micrarchaeota archaeon]
MLEFKKITKAGIISILKKISIQEHLPMDEVRLKQIAENANGDVRSAINDLQANSLGARDVEKDIFERVRGIFKSSSYLEAKKYFSGDVDYSLLKLWVDENIPLEYNGESSLSKAFNYLSRADVFDGRIKKSHWGYFKYSIDFITAGVALSKSHKSNYFVRYQFPSYLRLMGQTVDRRAKLKSIGKKIGRITHSNYREASEYLHIIKHFLESDFDSACGFYNLEEEEAAFILETTIEGMKKPKKDKEKKKVPVEPATEPEKKEPPKIEDAQPEKKKILKGNLKDFF